MDTKSSPRAATDPTRYRSYLLRLFREENGLPWRFQVNCVVTGEERRFASLQGLLEFLQKEAAQSQENVDFLDEQKNTGNETGPGC